MPIMKSNSLNENLNLLNNFSIKCSKSFSDFQLLQLNGEHKLLTFGEYSNLKKYNRINRRKLIFYFYKNKLNIKRLYSF